MAASDLQSVVEARELLPAWVVWGSDVLFVVASLSLTVPSVWLAVRFALRPLDRASNLHWTELARLSYPARSIPLGGGLLFLPLVLLCGIFVPAELSPLPRPWLAGIIALSIALLLVAIHCRLERRIGDDQLTFDQALRSVATRGLLFMPHVLIAVAMIPIIPADFSPLTFVELFLVGLVGLFFAVGGNLLLIRFLGLARVATPRLQDLCRRAAEPVGVRLRGAYELDWAVVNALAFPGIQCVAFTTRARARLSDDDLLAICGHECSHLRESKSALLTRMAVAVTVTLLVASIRPVATTFGPLGLIVGVMTYLVSSWLFAGFSKRMETRADAAACAAEPDPGAFARALERLYELNLVPAVINHRNALHPDLYDRLIAAGVKPAYPRPAALPRARTVWAVMLMLAPLYVAAAVIGVVIATIDSVSSDDEPMQKLALALQIDPAVSLGNLGLIRLGQGKNSGAIVLLRAATDLDSKSWTHPMHLARAYLAAGGADDAAAAIATARQRHAQASEAVEPVHQRESGVISVDLSLADPRSAHLRDGERLESLARLIDERRGVRLSRPEWPKPAPIDPMPIEPAGAEPPRVEPAPAPEAGPQPDEGRPWRRRGRGRGRFRSHPPMA